MKARKTFITVVCILLCVLFVLSISVMVIVPSYAASSSDIKAEINSLTAERSDIEDKIESIDAQLSALGDQMEQTMEKKAILDQKNALAQQELDVISEQIEIIDNYMANRLSDLEAAREREAEQEEAWLSRLRAMEENSELSYVQVLFDATSFSDLLTRIDAVNEITEYDEQLFNSYIEARQTVEELEAEAEEMSRTNEANKAELEERRVQLEADIASANELIAELQESVDGYNLLREAQEEADAELAALISEKQAEYSAAKAKEDAAAAAAEAARRAASGGDATFDGDGTTFLWPSYTTTLTSYFGNRESPGGIGSTNHKGIDIGASYGTSIWAAASGTVTLASWNGGYGNCVIVSHSNGYSTLYAHMSSIAVSAGQTVSQGQVLGYVGSTGNSTGPHLHFGVLAGGTYVNPLAFNYIYGS